MSHSGWKSGSFSSEFSTYSAYAATQKPTNADALTTLLIVPSWTMFGRTVPTEWSAVSTLTVRYYYYDCVRSYVKLVLCKCRLLTLNCTDYTVPARVAGSSLRSIRIPTYVVPAAIYIWTTMNYRIICFRFPRSLKLKRTPTLTLY